MASSGTRADRLTTLTGTFRGLHVPGRPLVLPNAWDAASARSVEAGGFGAVATASAAISASLGFEDGEGTPVDEMFAAIGRIVRAVSLPVTADIEAGYGLAPDQLVDRLLAVGAVGCNIEDSDHRHGGLVDRSDQAARIAAMRASAGRAGVPIVINARVDVFLPQDVDPAEQFDEGLQRCRLYLEAGADCAYPILLADESLIARFAAACAVRINVLAGPTTPPLPRLVALGVARISFGPWVQRLAMRAAKGVLADIAAGRDIYADRRRPEAAPDAASASA